MGSTESERGLLFLRWTSSDGDFLASALDGHSCSVMPSQPRLQGFHELGQSNWRQGDGQRCQSDRITLSSRRAFPGLTGLVTSTPSATNSLRR